MSLIIAIKDGDRVVVGSDVRGTSQNTYYDMPNNTPKAEKLENGIILGIAGAPTLRPCFKKALKDLTTFDRETLEFKVVLPLLSKLRNTVATCSCGDFDGCVIVAKDDKAFLISSNGAIEEVYKFKAIGSGEEVAFGYLYSVIASGMKPERMIANAIEVTSKVIYSVSPESFIADTKDKPFEKWQK